MSFDNAMSFGGFLLGVIAVLIAIFKAPSERAKSQSDVVGNFSEAANETIKTNLELQRDIEKLHDRLEAAEDELEKLKTSNREKDHTILLQDEKIRLQGKRIEELEAEVATLRGKGLERA